MRIGVAIDLHATADSADEVSWACVREQVLSAEQLGLDLVVLPDHLSYRAGGKGDYALADQSVGVRETVAMAAAVSAVTSTIGVGHSVINAPYRTPAMIAHVAACLAEISGGRYSLGVGVGNSFDYDQLGVVASHRVARFEEWVEVVSAMLRNGNSNLDGEYWAAANAELVLGPRADRRPQIVIAAGGQRTMRAAVSYGDAWNGWTETDPASTTAADLITLLERTCERAGRDPSSIGRTFDLGVDPLDLVGAKSRSLEMLTRLAELGVDEVRCYPSANPTHAARLEAIAALAELTTEIRP